MSTTRIKNHNFDRHHKAVVNLDAVLRKLDTDLRALDRREGMYDGEKRQREYEIRQAGMVNIKAARDKVAEAIADDRETAHYTEPAPSGEELQRRIYYAQQASNELAGLDAGVVLALVESVVESGDHERAREYVRASRGVMFNSDPGAWKRLDLATEPRDVKLHRSFAAAVDTQDANLPWLDLHVEDLVKVAGRVSEAERAGKEDPEPFSPRILTLWLDRVRSEAAVAFERTAARQDGVPPAAWAGPRAVRGAGAEEAASGAGAEGGSGDGS